VRGKLSGELGSVRQKINLHTYYWWSNDENNLHRAWKNSILMLKWSVFTCNIWDRWTISRGYIHGTNKEESTLQEIPGSKPTCIR
jgi:hypothetical protein